MVTNRETVTPQVRAEAAAWLARLRADDRTDSDQRAFQAWLAEEAAHGVAFEAVTAMWETAGALALRSTQVPIKSRRWALTAGAGSILSVGVAAVIWQSASAEVYETDVGEQKHVVLPDGTQVFLDTNSRIQARYDDELRRVDLERGRCNFRVMPSDRRPFVVDVANQRIVADQTTFDVRRDGDQVSVVCLQGRASIIDSRGRADRRTLTPGERLVAINAKVHLDQPNLAPLVAWQTGQAMFDNETLADAIVEMNRYSSVKLEVIDPAIARRRISGVYRVGDNAAFARSVAALLPVSAEAGSDRIRFVAGPSR